MKPILTLTIILATTFGSVGCKVAPKDGAAIKSLDDLAHKPGTTAPDYRCGTPFAGGALPDAVEPLRALVEPADAPLKNVVLGTAQALPDAVAYLIAGTRTRIRLVDDAVGACAGTPFSAAEKAATGNATPVRSCWRQSAAGERPELILQADRGVIEHNFLRLSSYLFSELLMARVDRPDAPAPFNTPAWTAAARSFKEARGELAIALLDDMKTFDDDTQKRFDRMHRADPVAFGNIAVAEAQDSYYCNAASRLSFASLFRKSYAAFVNPNNPGSMASLFGAR